MTSMVALLVCVVVAASVGNLSGYNLLDIIKNRNAIHKHYDSEFDDYFTRSQEQGKACFGFLEQEDAEPYQPQTFSLSRFKTDCVRSKDASIKCSFRNHRLTCPVLASLWNQVFPCEGGHYMCYRRKIHESIKSNLPICVCDSETNEGQCKQTLNISKKCTIDGRTDCECTETIKLLTLTDMYQSW